MRICTMSAHIIKTRIFHSNRIFDLILSYNLLLITTQWAFQNSCPTKLTTKIVDNLYLKKKLNCCEII
jgi:hypothetical protein